MKKIKLLFVLAFGAILMSSCGYNNMVQKQENIAQQWAQVENQYQRRADLVPNLVNTVKALQISKKAHLKE